MKKIRLYTTLLCSIFTLAITAIPTLAASESIPMHKEDVTSMEKSNDEFKQMIALLLEVKEENPQLDDEAFTKILEDKVAEERSIHARGISDIWNSLTTAERKLVIRYPFDALKVNEAKDIASTQTINKFGYSGLGDSSDAFRHGIWNAEMTVLIGADKADLFATAHEERDVTGMEADGFLKVEHKEMDLHNNSIGREIGSNNIDASEEQMAQLVYLEIVSSNSKFIWLHE